MCSLKHYNVKLLKLKLEILLMKSIKCPLDLVSWELGIFSFDLATVHNNFTFFFCLEDIQDGGLNVLWFCVDGCRFLHSHKME